MATASTYAGQSGYLSNTTTSAEVFKYAQPRMAMRKYTVKLKVQGKLQGDTVNFPKIGNLDQEYATSALDENLRIPESDATVTQGALVVNEWGRAIRYNHKVETLSPYEVPGLYKEALGDHMAKSINYAIAAQYKATYVKYTPNNATATVAGAFDTDGTISNTALRNVNALDLRTIKNRMVDTYHTAPYMGADDGPDFEYVFVASETTINNLLNDSDIATDVRYADMGAGRNSSRISGKLAVWNGILFEKDNQAFSSVMGGTSFNGEGVMFGKRAVQEVMVEVPGIRAKTPDDYGRSKGIAWYGIYGYKLTWGDNATDVTNNQIVAVHVTSV